MDNYIPVLKALADDTRFKIVDTLLHYNYCVSALARSLDITEAAVSQHMQILKKVGIVTSEKRGYFTHYEINRDVIIQSMTLIEKMVGKDYKRQRCEQRETGNHAYCDLNKPEKRITPING